MKRAPDDIDRFEKGLKQAEEAFLKENTLNGPVRKVFITGYACGAKEGILEMAELVLSRKKEDKQKLKMILSNYRRGKI